MTRIRWGRVGSRVMDWESGGKWRCDKGLLEEISYLLSISIHSSDPKVSESFFNKIPNSL